MADEEFTPEELELLDEMIANLKSINRLLSNSFSAGEKNSRVEPVLIDLPPIQQIPSEIESTMAVELKEDQIEDAVDDSLDLVNTKGAVQVTNSFNNGGLGANISHQVLKPFVPELHPTEVPHEQNDASMKVIFEQSLSLNISDLPPQHKLAPKPSDFSNFVVIVFSPWPPEQTDLNLAIPRCTVLQCFYWVIMLERNSIMQIIAQTEEPQLMFLTPVSTQLPPKPPDIRYATVVFAHTDLNESIDFFSVYDGHEGKVVARFCAKFLHQQMLKSAEYAQIMKHCEEADQVVNNELLKFYVEYGCFDEVLKVFEVMPQRNVVSWNTSIAGFAGLGRVFETLDAFRVMQREEGIGFSWVTLTTVLPKDEAGNCFPDLKLGNATDISLLYLASAKNYSLIGIPTKGWFSFYNLTKLADVSFFQGVHSRTSSFDGNHFCILTVEDVVKLVKPPSLGFKENQSLVLNYRPLLHSLFSQSGFVNKFPASISEICYLKLSSSLYNYIMRGTSIVVFCLRLKQHSVSYFIRFGMWCMLDVEARDVFDHDPDLYTKMVRYPLEMLAIFDLVLTNMVSQLNPIIEKHIQTQIVRLQETPNEIPEGGTPHTVSLLMHDKLVDAGKLGDIIELVEACHSLGVIHRDLKPENFLFDSVQEDAKHYGPESDVWSAGVILYVLLSDVPPFWDETEPGIFRQILMGKLDFQSQPWPSISDSAKDLIRRMLDQNPRTRPPAQEKLTETFHSSVRCADGNSSRMSSKDISKLNASRVSSYTDKDLRMLNSQAVSFIVLLMRNYMRPIECMPFYEILCFKDVEKLHSVLIGDPRSRIQADLLESHIILRCSCCNKSGTAILPSKRDSSIIWTFVLNLVGLNMRSTQSTIYGAVQFENVKGFHQDMKKLISLQWDDAINEWFAVQLQEHNVNHANFSEMTLNMAPVPTTLTRYNSNSSNNSCFIAIGSKNKDLRTTYRGAAVAVILVYSVAFKSCSGHNLEDKVIFKGEGIVMNGNTTHVMPNRITTKRTDGNAEIDQGQVANDPKMVELRHNTRERKHNRKICS